MITVILSQFKGKMAINIRCQNFINRSIRLILVKLDITCMSLRQMLTRGNARQLNIQLYYSIDEMGIRYD